MKICILGATGMLGSALVKYFSTYGSDYEFLIPIRNRSLFTSANFTLSKNMRLFDFRDVGDVQGILKKFPADVIINCIGIIKQSQVCQDPLETIRINSLFPHQLLKLSSEIGARLIHFSTDCVFLGGRGNYTELDVPDARDLYGLSKLQGELNYGNSLTLRTSIIGHEINGNKSLVDWYFSQKGSVQGYKNAIFSGLPTCEIAEVLDRFVLPKSDLQGVYHLSSSAINKYDLLCLIKDVYKFGPHIFSDETLKINRSLNSSKFSHKTGYLPPSWPELIFKMRQF